MTMVHDPYAPPPPAVVDPEGPRPLPSDDALEAIAPQTSVRRAAREYAERELVGRVDLAVLVHSLGLLDRIVAMFAGLRGSLPSEHVQNRIRSRHPLAYRHAVERFPGQRWNRFVRSTWPVLGLVRDPPDGENGCWRLYLACRDGAVWRMADAERAVRERRLAAGVDGVLAEADTPTLHVAEAAARLRRRLPADTAITQSAMVRILLRVLTASRDGPVELLPDTFHLRLRNAPVLVPS